MHPNRVILVVEDDQDIRESCAAVLRHAGATVLTASGGQQALDVLALVRPSMVVLDLMMPDVTGWEVFDKMRAHPGLAAVPVCIISAVANQAPPSAEKVLAKPIAIEELLDVVEQYC
jgi:CheY-like chemotaxis protein